MYSSSDNDKSKACYDSERKRRLPITTFRNWHKVPKDQWRTAKEWKQLSRRVKDGEKPTGRVIYTEVVSGLALITINDSDEVLYEDDEHAEVVAKEWPLYHISQTQPAKITRRTLAMQKYLQIFFRYARKDQYATRQLDPETGKDGWITVTAYDTGNNPWQREELLESHVIQHVNHAVSQRRLRLQVAQRHTIAVKSTDLTRFVAVDVDHHGKDDTEVFLRRVELLLGHFHGNGWHYQVRDGAITGIHIIKVLDKAVSLEEAHGQVQTVLAQLDKQHPELGFLKLEVYPTKDGNGIRLPIAKGYLMVLDKIVEPIVYRGQQAGDVEAYMAWLDAPNRQYFPKDRLLSYLRMNIEEKAGPVPAKPTIILNKDDTAPISSKRSKHSPVTAIPVDDDESGNNQEAVSLLSISLETNTPQVSLPTSSNTSIDRRKSEDSAVSPEKIRSFTIIKPREFSVNRIGAFVPENFAKEDEQRLGEHLEEAFCIFHNMHLFRVRTRQPKDAWIDLSYDYCDRRFPHWRSLKHMLLDGILERTEVESYPELGIVIPRGVKGHRCYGYRFDREEYRHATVRKRSITNPELIQLIEAHRNVKYPVQRWLERNLRQVEITDVPDDRLLELAIEGGDPQVRHCTYREQVELIRDKGWVFVVDDFSRRIHTNITSLKRELRGCLRVAGSPLVQIDIKNSQPLFIGLAAQRMGVDDSRYLELCQGDLYQHLADQGGWSRKEVKEQLTQQALFAPNSSPHQRLPVKQLFDQEFPKIAQFMRDTKARKRTKDNPKPHNALAKLAQKTEANFLIYGMGGEAEGVCQRIRRERSDCWISTIHDSILALPEAAEYVRGVMLEEFAKIGVQPRLEVEQCDE